jgi:hypothetical protein
MNAAKEAGLANGWVKSGDGKYTYTGTQEDINGAKDRLDTGFGKVQSDIDAAQNAYSRY